MFKEVEKDDRTLCPALLRILGIGIGSDAVPVHRTRRGVSGVGHLPSRAFMAC